MTDKLKYNDFIGSVHFSALDNVFFGKIEGINDLVTFEAENVSNFKRQFKEAVEDYQMLCTETGKDVFESFKGSLNVRLNPELHSKVFEYATINGKTLNQYIKDTLEEKIVAESQLLKANPS